jgi:uncharacterized membrane protein SpoIIM required for sporulation
MKQAQFEAQHGPLWEQLNQLLAKDGAGREQLPALYRRLCQCLALAGQRGYSPTLVDYLHDLVARCHRRLYGTAAERPAMLMAWLRHDFPRRVRAEWRLLALITLVFWGSALAVALAVWFDPHKAYLFAAPEQLAKMRDMYQPTHMQAGRGNAGDVQMFGHYIWNNVSIGFRTFAGGLFGGLPALYSVLFNGLHLGVVAAWLTQDHATRLPFWSFVVTHSSFEITGLLLSGVAGVRLGLALLRPGRLSRRHALQASSRATFPIVAGAALLTVLAAFFEAFWSASPAIPPQVKLGVGAVCWLMVLWFFIFAGRQRQEGVHATR